MKTTLSIIFAILATATAIGASTETEPPKPFVIPKIQIPPGAADVSVPKILKDKNSGLIFYIESDQRHIAAIDETGKIRWVVDMADLKFTDQKIVIRKISIGDDGNLFVSHGPGFSFSTIDIKTGIVRYRGTD